MADRTPLVLIHGFTDSTRTWDTLRPLLEPHHDLLVPATLGHHGGAPLPEEPMASPLQAMVDDLEAQMDETGLERAHLVGNSLGGQIAIELAARGRALSLVALAPGGGWEEAKAVKKVMAYFERTRKLTPFAAARAHGLVSRPRLRKLVLRDVVAHGDRVPPAVAEALLVNGQECAMFEPLRKAVGGGQWHSDELAPITVPVRVVWGSGDRILPPRFATAHWRGALTDAEWIEVDGLGHILQLDDPHQVARLVLEVSAPNHADVPA
ncbi:MAG: alpha/beta fold hydrolase [Solirubrobacterales bacterium]|nr:alpha/beta fold hydrolase [Solirubrobacterales bacterium]